MIGGHAPTHSWSWGRRAGRRCRSSFVWGTGPRAPGSLFQSSTHGTPGCSASNRKQFGINLLALHSLTSCVNTARICLAYRENYGAFPPEGAIGSVCKGAALVVFPPAPKVAVIRTETYWAVLVSQYSSVWVLRHLKGCRQDCSSNDWSTVSSESSARYSKKITRKSLTSVLDVLHCCSFILLRSSFSLDFIAGYTVTGCYEVPMLT